MSQSWYGTLYTSRSWPNEVGTVMCSSGSRYAAKCSVRSSCLGGALPSFICLPLEQFRTRQSADMAFSAVGTGVLVLVDQRFGTRLGNQRRATVTDDRFSSVSLDNHQSE